MSRQRLLFFVYCFLLWPAAIFVACYLQAPLSHILWWLLAQSGATHLDRSMFSVDAWLPVVAAEAFALGLMPLHEMKAWARAAFGRFHQSATEVIPPETRPENPLLWAWVLPTLTFLIRFTLYGVHHRESVLESARGLSSGPGRLSHFFGPMNFEVSLDYLHWANDRLFLTTPMLFLLAYPAAVLLRHRLPALPTHKPADTLGS